MKSTLDQKRCFKTGGGMVASKEKHKAIDFPDARGKLDIENDELSIRSIFDVKKKWGKLQE
jgi:hypothetical protein